METQDSPVVWVVDAARADAEVAGKPFLRTIRWFSSPMARVLSSN